MKAGLLGYPIGHSLSPAIHRAAYAELGLAWDYALYPCEDKDAFLKVIAEARQESGAFVGFNVTTPYKAAAYAACTERSLASTVTGSANVLILLPAVASAQPRLRGEDTDGRGLVASLEHDGNATVAGSSVVVCGTGPVALSVLLALIDAKVASVTVASRNVAAGDERVRKLRERVFSCELRETSPMPELRVVDYAQAARCLETANILIDATPVGMSSTDQAVVPSEALRPNLIVLDTVYGHGETALIKAARETGAVAIDGLGMLIEQAALTIELWAKAQGLSLVAPRETMRARALVRAGEQ
jgi:shikimate dehydrogenase